jgi:transcription termination factor Rho
MNPLKNMSRFRPLPCKKQSGWLSVVHDVVILLDSITRLTRAHNTVAPRLVKFYQVGVEANAMQKPSNSWCGTQN